jgi:hypothetical protein
MRVGRMCPTKSKIPMVAIFASERVDQKECAHDSFHGALLMRPVHQVAAAPWANLIFTKVYRTHKAVFISAGANNLPLLLGCREYVELCIRPRSGLTKRRTKQPRHLLVRTIQCR